MTTEATPILQWIEVASSLQLPSFHVIGLPSQEVAEARERVRAAIEASGFKFPRNRVIINLSPASIRKRGTGADLAMALGIITSTEAPKALDEDDCIVACGELGLDGRIKPVGQVMRMLYASWKSGASKLIFSPEDYAHARKFARILEKEKTFFGIPTPDLYPASTLREAWTWLQNPNLLPMEALQPVEFSQTAPCPQLLPLSPGLNIPRQSRGV